MKSFVDHASGLAMAGVAPPQALQPRLIEPYGGRLIDLLVPAEERLEKTRQAHRLPAVPLSERSANDLTLLATGAFSPLDRFMGSADYLRVCDEMRLSSGQLFPIPLTLPVHDTPTIALGQRVALRYREELLARMTIEEIFSWSPAREAEKAYATRDPNHPMVQEMASWGPLMISGPLEVLALPEPPTFRELCLTPAATRERLVARGRADVAAFQTRNPLHRAHEALIQRAVEQIDGTLLLHPVLGKAKAGDIDPVTRVRTYNALVRRFPEPERIVLALLPLAMRMAGPREALWHTLIRRNYGANHLIVGRDHASPGLNSRGEPFYSRYAAQELIAHHSEELGVKVIPCEELVYLPDEDRYEEISSLPPETRSAALSGTQVRQDYLYRGRPLPEWFTHPEVAEILAEAYPPRHRQGLCIWLTDTDEERLTAISQRLSALLQERGRRTSLLGSDLALTLSARGRCEEGQKPFSGKGIVYVASEIVEHGGIALIGATPSQRAHRQPIRERVGSKRFLSAALDASPAAERDDLCLEPFADDAEVAARKLIEGLTSRGFVRVEAPGNVSPGRQEGRPFEVTESPREAIG